MFLLSVMWLLENVKILYCYAACLVTIAGEHKTQVLHINPTAAQQQFVLELPLLLDSGGENERVNVF